MDLLFGQPTTSAASDDSIDETFGLAMTSFDEHDLCSPFMISQRQNAPSSAFTAAQPREFSRRKMSIETTFQNVSKNSFTTYPAVPLLPSKKSTELGGGNNKQGRSGCTSGVFSPYRVDRSGANDVKSLRRKAATVGRMELCVPVRTSSAKPLLSPFNYHPPDQVGEYVSIQQQEARHAMRHYASSPQCIKRRGYQRSPIPHRRLSYDEPERRASQDTETDSLTRQEEIANGAPYPSEYHVEASPEVDLDLDCDHEFFESKKSRKPRLWLNLSEDDDTIEEAHVVKMMPSPSKPRMTSIGRSRESGRRHETSPTSSMQDISYGPIRSNDPVFHPETPPETPQHSPSRQLQLKDGNGFFTTNDLRDRLLLSTGAAFGRDWSMTPPSSQSPTLSDRPLETARSSDVEQSESSNVIADSCAAPRERPPTPVPFSAKATEKYTERRNRDIIIELETAIRQPARASPLELTNPIFTQIRLVRTQALSRILPKAPLSKYSSLPSSSRMTKLDLQEGNESVGRLDNDDPRSFPKGLADYEDTLTALRSTFPTTPLQLVEKLLVNLLALLFVDCSISSSPLLPEGNASSQKPSKNASRDERIPRSRSMNSSLFLHQGMACRIPSKAQAMLGITSPSSTPLGLPSRPPLPTFWARQESWDWNSRLDELSLILRKDIGKILDTILSSNVTHAATLEREALISALLVIVKIGETKSSPQ